MSNESINHPNASEKGNVKPGKKMLGKQIGHNTPKEAVKSNQSQHPRQRANATRAGDNKGDAHQRSDKSDTR